MRRFGMAVLLAIGFTACSDVTQPSPSVIPSEESAGAAQQRVQAPSSPSLSTSEVDQISISTIVGPGVASPITSPGSYSWGSSSTSNNSLQPTIHEWYISWDGGSSWTRGCQYVVYYQTYVQSQCSFQIDRSGTPLIKLVAMVGAARAERSLSVTAAMAFAARIEGPGSVSTEGTQTWQAVASYGTGSYSYRWRVYWNQSGMWEDLGTSEFESIYVVGAYGSFQLEATVTSGPETITTTKLVCNFIPPTDYSCS